ncbi:hypothetical protein C7379_1031 [Hallella colorans]|uniref:Uncharacterized protein n=1 Tax=Hallella colorans TaxID=1703337 RepID=A0A2U0UJU2_9BACT|nr:hypothetical protein C7379_1031 [Hallella colorans]
MMCLAKYSFFYSYLSICQYNFKLLFQIYNKIYLFL